MQRILTTWRHIEPYATVELSWPGSPPTVWSVVPSSYPTGLFLLREATTARQLTLAPAPTDPVCQLLPEPADAHALLARELGAVPIG